MNNTGHYRQSNGNLYEEGEGSKGSEAELVSEALL